jgi:hypothetical protein
MRLFSMYAGLPRPYACGIGAAVFVVVDAAEGAGGYGVVL